MATAEAPMKRESLYAPAAPFAAAMEEWMAIYRKRNRAVRCTKTPQGSTVQMTGLEALARRSGIPARRLRAYQSGESKLIELHNADRLCIALGVALWVLADDFRPMHEWRKRNAA